MTLAARRFHATDSSILSDAALLADAGREATLAARREETPKWQPSDEGKAAFKAKAEERARAKAALALKSARAEAKPLFLHGVADERLMIQAPITSATAMAFFTKINSVKATTLDIALAIGAFMGYQRAEPFGVQEFTARWVAMSVCRPTTLLRMKRIPSTVEGFVAGMPNEDRKVYLDLVGRESLALNAMLDAEALISASDVTPEVATELRAMAREHADALDAICQALRDFAKSMGLVGED